MKRPETKQSMASPVARRIRSRATRKDTTVLAPSREPLEPSLVSTATATAQHFERPKDEAEDDDAAAFQRVWGRMKRKRPAPAPAARGTGPRARTMFGWACCRRRPCRCPTVCIQRPPGLPSRFETNGMGSASCRRVYLGSHRCRPVTDSWLTVSAYFSGSKTLAGAVISLQPHCIWIPTTPIV